MKVLLLILLLSVAGSDNSKIPWYHEGNDLQIIEQLYKMSVQTELVSKQAQSIKKKQHSSYKKQLEYEQKQLEYEQKQERKQKKKQRLMKRKQRKSKEKEQSKLACREIVKNKVLLYDRDI